MRTRILAAAVAVWLSTSATALAHDGGSLTHKGNYLRTKVVRVHGKRAPGRDIIRLGLRNGKQPSKHQKANYVRQLRQLLAPPPAMLLRTAVPPARAPAGTLSAGYTGGSVLQAIAQCESGGKPDAIGGGGVYRGLLQFTYETWASVGGTGDPAAASVQEQYKRGALLYQRSGPGQWPVCGR